MARGSHYVYNHLQLGSQNGHRSKAFSFRSRPLYMQQSWENFLEGHKGKFNSHNIVTPSHRWLYGYVVVTTPCCGERKGGYDLSYVSVRPYARSSMSSSSSVRGSVILGNQSGSTTRWQVEQESVPSQAPGRV